MGNVGLILATMRNLIFSRWQTYLNTKQGHLILKNILVVPNLKKNLLSVAQLTLDNSCSIAANSHDFVIKDPQGKTLAKGHKKGGLYALQEDCHHALTAVKTSKGPLRI